MDSYHLTQDRDKLWDFVKTAMKTSGSIQCGIFLSQLNDSFRHVVPHSVELDY
jgi:hypothetical protein